MIQLFRKNKATINSIQLPDLEWLHGKDEKGIKQWLNPEKTIVLSQNFFNEKPDVPSLVDIAFVRQYYRQLVSENNGGIIQVDFLQLDKHKAIKTVFKFPKYPSGFNYLVSLTIPFKNCSYVVKLQSNDVGVSSRRDSIIIDKLLKEGVIVAEGNKYKGWQEDPYEKRYAKGSLMNKSEAEKYDHDFPDHPLSKLRSLMMQLEKEITFNKELESISAFKN